VLAKSKLQLSSISLAALASLTLASLALAGCGVGINADPSATTVGAVLQGTALGGVSPIVGANVVLWETDPTNSGYPSSSNKSAVILAGNLLGGLGAVTTDSNGKFSFTSTTYSCAANTFLYITVTGGSAGAGTNPNLVEIAYAGPCANFNTSSGNANIHVTVNEATTIAMAYALGSFTYVDNTTPGLQGVYIGAPAKNNATVGSCTGTGSSMTCTAAGLAHAFANAYALVDSYEINNYPTSARQYSPYNSSGSVPEALINTLANILAYCTNSTGLSTSGLTSTGATDGTNCGNLFSTTRIPSCAANTCAPADELTAAINIAKNPAHAKGACTATAPYTSANPANSLYCLVSGTTPFLPTLTTASHDWAIAITYLSSNSYGNISTFGSPEWVTLDANDNVYILNTDLPTATEGNIVTLASDGAPLWSTAYSTAFCLPKFIVTDTVGNVWATNGASTTACASATAPNYAIYGFSQATGAPTYTFGAATSTGNGNNASSPIAGSSAPFGLAVDQYNNLFFDRNVTTVVSTSGYLYELKYSGGGSPGGTYGNQVALADGLGNLNQIVIDGDQNVWVSTLGTSSSSTPQDLYVVPNLNAPATYGGTQTLAPSYPGASGTNPYYSLAGISGSGYSFGVTIDGSGNAWDQDSNGGSAYTNEVTITPSTPGSQATVTNGGVITAIADSSISFASETKPYGTEFDGNGEFWYAYYSSSGEIYYVYNPTGATGPYAAAASNQGVVPCYAAAGAATCSTNLIAYDPIGLQIDSTGTLWLAAKGNGVTANPGSVLQFIGMAAPTWPQLSYAHFGVEPK